MSKEKIATPACFPSREVFRIWGEAARLTGVGKSQWCTDCTPDYQQRMMTQHRCAYPGTTFAKDANGMVEGCRTIEDRRDDRARDDYVPALQRDRQPGDV
jgi:hypothetical protein